MADWIPNLLAGWAVQLLGVLSPGPGVALILTVATTKGRAPAIVTCFGIGAGAVCLSTAALVGLGTLVAEIAWAMMAVKVAGAGYLAWLSWKAFERAKTPPPAPVVSPAKRRRGGAALAGFAMQITNPKAIVYWLAAVAMANMTAAPLPVLAFFVLGAFAISFLGHGTWALALSSRPFIALYGRARRWIDAALSAFFAFTAYKLLTTRI
nr:LysE family translocator [Cognatishimia sp. F0-27]